MSAWVSSYSDYRPVQESCIVNYCKDWYQDFVLSYNENSPQRRRTPLQLYINNTYTALICFRKSQRENLILKRVEVAVVVKIPLQRVTGCLLRTCVLLVQVSYQSTTLYAVRQSLRWNVTDKESSFCNYIHTGVRTIWQAGTTNRAQTRGWVHNETCNNQKYLFLS